MRILGIDPGTEECGWSLIETRGGRGQPIATTFLDGGNISVEPESIRHWVVDLRPDLVAVEWIEGIAFPASSKAQHGLAAVPHLIASAAVAGGIAWMALTCGFSVRKMSARDWRRTLLAKPHASDQEIAARLPRLFAAGWPKRSNKHVRDAAGVAMAAAWVELSGRRVA